MDLPQLSKDRSLPLVDQLAEHFRQAIQQAELRPGDRLPTIRQVAQQSDVARTTVQDAYRRLAAEGLVETMVGRGTVVMESAQMQAQQVGREFLNAGAWAALQHLRQQAEATVPPLQGECVADFAGLYPDQELFPVADFQASLLRVLQDRGKQLLGYGEPSGDLELRRLLAEREEGEESAQGGLDEVLITNGAQQGIDLVLRALTRPGDAVAVAIPTYHHLFGLLKAHGLRLLPLRCTADGGLHLDDLRAALEQPELRLLYLMPTFTNPTGHSIGLQQRQQIMAMLQETQVPVLEDEFELELRFRGDELPSLRSLDARGLTVTVRTFSKGLFPGVRMGWVHANAQLLEPMAALKRFTDLETSPLLQAALQDFIHNGSMDRHLEFLRGQVQDRHAAAQQALSEFMPVDWRWSKPDGGFALWVEGPDGFDSQRLVQAAAQKGVLLSPGGIFYPHDHPVPGVRLSLSRASAEGVQQGIQIIGHCVDQLLAQTGSPSQSPLFL